MTVKADKLLVRAEIYNFIMIYLLAAIAYLTITLLDTNPPQILTFVVLAVIEAVSYISRRLINKMIIYLIVHFCIPILFIFIPLNPVGIMTVAIAWIVFLMLDLYAWGRPGLYGFSYVPILFELAVAVMYFLSWLARKPLNSYLIFGLGVLYFVLYYLRETNYNLYRLAYEGQGEDTMPLDIIRRNCFRILLPPLLACAVVMLLTRADGLNEQIYSFFKTLAGVIMLLIYIITYSVEKFVTGLIGEYEEEPPVIMMAETAAQGQHSVLLDIVDYVIVAVILGVVIWVVIRIVKSIIDGIEAKEEGKVESISRRGMIEIREKIPKKQVADERKLSRIRKEYKHRIEAASNHGYKVKRGQTPNERIDDLRKDTGEDITELTELYVKERYGKTEK